MLALFLDLPQKLIRSREDCFAGGWLAGIDALALHATLWLVERDDAQGGLGLFFDGQFGGSIFSPFDTHKAALLRAMIS